MPRMVWFVLKDGRSMIASCDGMTRERLGEALRVDRILTLTADDQVARLDASDIRDYLLFDSYIELPPNIAVYHFAAA
ncbi:MAG TPA: hypothetical protein VMT00_03750 [Thermoanaerobaculia bacterium]|nr:hypothetical protein [Thermoanaerobaculia bacterium]